MHPPRMSAEDLEDFLAREFPQAQGILPGHRVERVEAEGVTMRVPFAAGSLRPGGTISGPTMFALADLALYAAVLAAIGPVALAVTTGMTINFMRKPGAADLVARCRLLKLGRQLAVGDVEIRSEGHPDIVAHAVGTYAIPPKR